MTNIREVFALNLKKFRKARGWSQEKLAENTGTSKNYIGMLENTLKFPSSKMIQNLAATLCVDPTDFFSKETDPETAIRNAKKAAFLDVGEAVNEFLSNYIEDKVAQCQCETIKA